MNCFGRLQQISLWIGTHHHSAAQRLLNRSFTLSTPRHLKQIIHSVSEDGKTITIEGVYLNSSRTKFLANFEKIQESEYFNPEEKVVIPDDVQKSKACSLCRLGLEVKHTDVLILHQFLDPSGDILQRDVTGLCKTQQKRIGYLVEMAKLAGILKTPNDPEPKFRGGFMKYNKYYDESVIDEFFAGKRNKA